MHFWPFYCYFWPFCHFRCKMTKNAFLRAKNGKNRKKKAHPPFFWFYMKICLMDRRGLASRGKKTNQWSNREKFRHTVQYRCWATYVLKLKSSWLPFFVVGYISNAWGILDSNNFVPFQKKVLRRSRRLD